MRTLAYGVINITSAKSEEFSLKKCEEIFNHILLSKEINHS